MSRFGAVAAILLASAVASAGPTKHVGQELTKGVGAEVKKEAQGLDVQKGARDIGAGLVEGVHQHDEQAAASARTLGRAIAQGFFGELRVQLGRDGDGALAGSLAGAGERGTGAAIHGAAAEVARYLPECNGKDRGACLDAMVSRLAYASSRAAARGAVDGAPPYASLLMFGAGLGVGLIAAALIALLVGQRRTRRTLAALRPEPA